MRRRIQALEQGTEIQVMLNSLDQSTGPLLALTRQIQLLLGAATEPGEAAQVSLCLGCGILVFLFEVTLLAVFFFVVVFFDNPSIEAFFFLGFVLDFARISVTHSPLR